MQDNLQNSEDVKKFLLSKKLPDNFCIIPFINMILAPGGDISVCRQKGSKHVIGSLKNNSLKEVWNNDYIKKWRTEFLEGRPEICAHEVKYVHCHLSPENYMGYEDFPLNIEQNYPFPKLTANLNGECNLRCIMCDVWRQENGFYDNSEFWNNANEEIFPYIKEVELLSGEPLIQDDIFKLIDNLSTVNKDVLWSITTNGDWDLENKVQLYLDKIKIKRFIFSIDSLIPIRYEKIRVNGNLSNVLSNLTALCKTGPLREIPFLPTIHFLIMNNNFDEIIEVVRFSREIGAKLILDLCEYPNNLSLFSLPEDKRKSIVTDLIMNMPQEYLQSIGGVLLRLINSLKHKKELLIILLDRKNSC